MIKIYVACLASYNSGHLFGKWLDLDDYKNSDELHEAIEEKILKNPKNPCADDNPEEFAIHDFEAPKGIEIEEYSDLSELMEMNDILNEPNGEIILGVKAHLGLDSLEDAREYYDDNYFGEHKDWTDFAYYYAEEINGWKLDEGIGRYFDAEAFGRDLSFEFFEIDGHFFHHS